MSSQQDRILDQFTRQAEPFSNAAPINDGAALARIVEATAAGPHDTVLDVACGPGIVVAAFAPHVRHASGIDLTPAMIDRAEQLARERHLSNTEFHVGDVQRLPFANESFSIVVTRLAFHHFEHPAEVLAEMRRVCRKGGVVGVVDLFASADPVKARAMNVMERLRDPSHVRALPLAEIRGALSSRRSAAAHDHPVSLGPRARELACPLISRTRATFRRSVVASANHWRRTHSESAHGGMATPFASRIR